MDESSNFKIEPYLNRIGLSTMPRVSEAGVQRLHHAQFYTIPFENLDIQLGRGIDLSPDALFTKLVLRHRGGYCFELNGLMLMALRAFGFNARPLLARVHLINPPGGHTHQISCVEIGGRRWIVDVGFGASGPRVPMPLEAGSIETGQDWAFRLERREPWGWMMQSKENGDWLDSYSFDMGHVTPADIEIGNYFTSTSPGSVFARTTVASLPHPNGRVSLSDYTLTEIENGHKATREAAPGQAYLDVLADYFGIKLDVPFSAFRNLGYIKEKIMGFLWAYDQKNVDWNELSELYRIAPLGEKPPDTLESVFSNSKYKCFVYSNHSLVGAGRALADGLDCSYICDVAVHPEHQRLGIGRQIVQKLVAFSQEHKKIILYANPGKEGFYGKLGFCKMNTAMAIFSNQAHALESGLISSA
jgi:N-hydroxyarylamine O-acetyltransferase